MPSKIGTSAAHWFARGVMGGFLLMAAVNAVSYFFRTGGFGTLLGYEPMPTEAIGFPMEIWNENKTYRGFIVDYRAMGINLLVALLPGVLFGMIGVWFRDSFNQHIHEFEEKEANSKRLSLQFSTKTLLILTTVVAVAVAALSTWRESRITLAAIYLLSPALLIALAMLPDSIRWYWRALLLVIVAKATIGIGIASGMSLGVPFEKVMFGIFVCWVPQSVFAAFLITAWLVFQALGSDKPSS
ncbi:hypothetical protein N9L06_05350 [Mariniblastus sp.]|nr:hypothetical protein [Mariniblastus sp.]